MVEVVQEGKKIVLGRYDENITRVKKFNIGNLLANYPDATYTLLNKRPGDEAAYIVAASHCAIEGNCFLWTIHREDVAKQGKGRCELRLQRGEEVFLSYIWDTEIWESLSGTGTPPDPWETWLQELINASVDVTDAVEEAKSTLEGYVSDAESARDDAITAKNSAESANADAQTAKGIAESSGQAAVQAKQDAESAASSASSSASDASDYAERAETAASVAESAKSEAQTAAATATSKAADASRDAEGLAEAVTAATSAAQTATAKASIAASSADSASASASNAAQSEENAADSEEAAESAASSAAASATSASSAATTATGKANEASASATTASAKASEAAQSALNAAGSATSAGTYASSAQGSASEASGSANRAETAATNAYTSATAASSAASAAQTAKTDAETAASTATTKASAAAQSATDAGAAATAAAGSAGTAATKAGEAAESATAAAGSAEDAAEALADFQEEKADLEQDIADLNNALTHKADIDGYYEGLTVGNAEQLVASEQVTEQTPYHLSPSGRNADIGNREYLDEVVGGTVAWNQAVQDAPADNVTESADIVTVDDAVDDSAGVVVQINPVQDLHGQDAPYPPGGGKNKLPVYADGTATSASCTIKTNANGSVTITGTSSGQPVVWLSNDGTFKSGSMGTVGETIALSGTYILSGSSGNPFFRIDMCDSGGNYVQTGDGTVTLDGNYYVRIIGNNGVTYNTTIYPMIRLSSVSDATFAPYSNECPISGWEGVNVNGAGRNLYGGNDIEIGASSYYYRAYDLETALKQLKPGQTYTGSAVFYARESSAADVTVSFRDGQQSFRILKADTRLSTARQSFTFTIPANVKWDALRYVLAYGGAPDDQTVAYIKDIQIEPGSTASDYEAYSGSVYPITLPSRIGTVYGWQLEVKRDGTGVVVVNAVKVTLDGSESASSSFWQDMIVVSNTDWIAGSNAKNCTILTCVSSLTQDRQDKCYVDVSSGITRIGFGLKYLFETANDFKAFLSSMANAGNPVEVVYEIAEPVTYNLTASEVNALIRTQPGLNHFWADSGNIALTYTGTDEHLTLTSGRKYFTRVNGTDSVVSGSGQSLTARRGRDNVMDLTRMFGSSVADYVYTQGAGFFRKWFPKSRYPFNVGELMHVGGVSAHETVGFNQWDEEWEVGGYYTATGLPWNTNDRIRSKNFIPVIGDQTYYISIPGGTNSNVFFYDKEQDFIIASAGTNNAVFTTPSNACYMKFNTGAGYGTTYKNNICINLSHSGSRNGQYQPYIKRSYPLDSSLTLRGVPKVSANGVYWDGDRYMADGSVVRRYGVVDLGTLTWRSNSQGLYSMDLLLIAKTYPDNTPNCILFEKYLSKQSKVGGTYANEPYTISLNANGYLYTSATEAPTGLCVYELKTPTSESADPFRQLQIVDDWGTEAFVSTSPVPVGHVTRYPANLRDKVQHLPDLASGNGIYLVKQDNSEMQLLKLPDYPSANGNYRLKLNIASGSPTFSWEVV